MRLLIVVAVCFCGCGFALFTGCFANPDEIDFTDAVLISRDKDFAMKENDESYEIAINKIFYYDGPALTKNDKFEVFLARYSVLSYWESHNIIPCPKSLELLVELLSEMVIGDDWKEFLGISCEDYTKKEQRILKKWKECSDSDILAHFIYDRVRAIHKIENKIGKKFSIAILLHLLSVALEKYDCSANMKTTGSNWISRYVRKYKLFLTQQ